jgi:hypothetical protein|tara:strand:+ start:102 stop:239 length:138 start_codon:yes stop_codon:yes gene_type:complete
MEMTAGYGWGMLSVGLIAILIGGLIAFFIINKVIKEENETEKSDS